MTLQEQVCTLEQAKRLKELGVSQECYWQWFTNDAGAPSVTLEWYGAYGVGCYVAAFAAFSVAELGVMLPDTTTIRINPEGTWYWRSVSTGIASGRNYPTEAQARAALLIHCLSNGYETPEAVNARLTPQPAQP